MEKLKDEVIEKVCQFYNIKPAQVLAYRRTAEVAKVRQIIFAILRRFQFPYQRIGETFGRDHTTVLYGVINAERKWPFLVNELYLEINKNLYSLALTDLDAEREPISEERYHYLAHRINKGWIDDRKNILDVTRRLHIGLRRFAFITERYGIKKC